MPLNMKNPSRINLSNSRRTRNILTLALVIVAGVLTTAAVVQNRGFHVEAQLDQISLTLQPPKSPTSPIATDTDASPIVTAADAHVEVHVTRPTIPNSPPASKREGLSTHGAASPIVTGQGAVVKATVDIRP